MESLMIHVDAVAGIVIGVGCISLVVTCWLISLAWDYRRKNKDEV